MTLGVVWLEHTGENAVASAAAAALGALGTQSVGLIGSLPWPAVASAAGIGALVSVLNSVASLAVPNATASWNKRVVKKADT